MGNKKYQVFISSTYSDLIEERRKILDVLLTADCIPAGMEAFVATDAEQFEVIKQVIDLCDYYVLIIGKRYGSISPETGISYTEMEYDYAIDKGIPVLVFAIDNSVELPIEKTETDFDKIKKLEAFRNKAMTNRLATIWQTSDELTGRLAIAIMKAKTDIKRPGWQRAVDFDEVSLRREIMNLHSKNEELKSQIVEKQNTIELLKQQSNLAFDDCEFTIKYHYYIKTGSKTQTKQTKTITLSMPELYRIIATEMTDVAISEHGIEQAIKSHLMNETTSVFLDDNQIIKRILLQLKALGLVSSRWSKRNNQLFWGLTKTGEQLRDNMILRFNEQETKIITDLK